MTKRFRKDDIEFHSDGSGRTAHAAVNVKVYKSYQDEPLPFSLGRVSEAGGPIRDIMTDAGFTHDWIEEHLTEREIEGWWTTAREDGWEELSDAAADIFGNGYAVFGEGRSGGWAVVHYGRREQFDRDDVAGWDAIALSRWARFATAARAIADYVPHRMVDSIYANVYEPWKDEQDANAKEEAALPVPNR